MIQGLQVSLIWGKNQDLGNPVINCPVRYDSCPNKPLLLFPVLTTMLYISSLPTATQMCLQKKKKDIHSKVLISILTEFKMYNDVKYM